MANEIFMKEMLDSKEFFTPIQYNLIKTLVRLGPLTRKDLVNQLRTPRTTIYDNLLKLHKRKMVEKFSRNDGKRGRPLIFWKIKD
ncbi:MAG: helix-turn-helix domain-containing protein [Promethearchaeota archaeon]